MQQRNGSLWSNITREENLVLTEVLTMLRSVRFGAVQITVHEGKAVQIEKTERQRLDRL